MTESIAVSSGKGGVGKTTIAVNIALTLAKKGNKTLLLDADLGMANAHLVLGVNPEKTLDDFINKKNPLSKISYKINKNLDFISGGSAVHSLLNLENTERYNIIKSFNEIKKTYDYMIIDVGAGADASSISFMSAANKIITVLVSEPTSFADAYSLVKASYLDEKLDNGKIISSNIFGKIFNEVEMPKGILNIVHGYGETTGKRLVEHEAVNQVVFTGSPEVASEILKKYNIPFIADEVICGFGRTGNLWGSQTYNIDPDIIIASKCITSGFFPLGAVILGEKMTKEMMEASYEAEEFFHGFTAGGHPVGCALALEAIDIIINEKMIENVRHLEPIFMGGLKNFEDLEFIGESRGIGLMGALEMVQDKKNKLPFDGSISIGERVANKCIENGLICRPLGPSIVLCPPFITSEEEMGIIFDTLEKTLKEVFSEVKSLGQ